MSTRYCLGQNALNGHHVHLNERELNLHTLIAGGTGRGKSKLIEGRLRYLISRGVGGAVLDPHGYLVEDLIAYASAAGLRNRVVIINANDPEYSVGLNFLAQRTLDAAALAAQVMRAIAKVFGEADSDTKPRLERWIRNTLIALIESGLTLADMLDFLSVSSAHFRQAALAQCQNEYVQHEWAGFNAMSKRAEKENLIEGPLNRAVKMVGSDQIRRIVGQQQSTIDLGEIIESGKVVLVNLAPLKVSRECQQMLGILLVDQIVNYAATRTKRQATRPFHVIVDEAAELMSNDIPYALQACRKFGVFFTICYQTLAQIKKIPGYAETVMSNTDCKVVFKVSREDSEELIGELFAGGFRGDMVKDEIYRTMLIPKETVREIISDGVSHAESNSDSESSGESQGDGYAFGASLSSASSVADQFEAGGGSVSIFPSGQARVVSQSDSRNESWSSFDARNAARSTSHGSADSTSRTRTVVPFYEYIREMELSSRQYFSIEELKEKYISWVMCQPQRHAQLKIGDRKAIPIITAFVEEVRVREKDKQRVREQSNAKYALPHPVVDRMIESRRAGLIERPVVKTRLVESDLDLDRWQAVPAEVV